MGVRNDAQDYFPWWWDAGIGNNLGGGFGVSTGGGGAVTTTGGAITSITAIIAALMAKGYTKEQAEKFIRDKTYPHKQDIPEKSIPQTGQVNQGIEIPEEEMVRLGRGYGISTRENWAESNQTLGRPYGISIPETGQDVPTISIPQTGQDVTGIEIPEEEMVRLGRGYGISNPLTIPETGQDVPTISIPQTGQDVFPEIKIPEEELAQLGRPYGISNPTPGDVAIPTPGDVAIPTPGDVAIPTPGDVAIPTPGHKTIPKPNTKSEVIPKEEITTSNKNIWETENFYPPMINVEKNEEQGEQIMTGLSDTTKENIEYPIDYSGLEAWLMQQQQKMWDREDQIRKETQEREDTAYQRAVEDARKAGINVNLMNLQPAASGGGISTATGLYSGMLENAMSGHSNRYINSMNVGSNEYIAQLNNATKIMEAQINNNFKGSEGEKQRLLDLISEIINGAAMIYAFKKGGK